MRVSTDGVMRDVPSSENGTSRESEEEMVGPFRTQIQGAEWL